MNNFQINIALRIYERDSRPRRSAVRADIQTQMTGHPGVHRKTDAIFHRPNQPAALINGGSCLATSSEGRRDIGDEDEEEDAAQMIINTHSNFSFG